jgi:hypothetical protein
VTRDTRRVRCVHRRRSVPDVIERAPRRWRPFWIHQGAEYLVGLVLVAAGVQSPDPTFPALAGGLIVANAAVVDGPLGAFRFVSRPGHRILDVVVAAVVAVTAVLPFVEIDGASRATMLVMATILGFLWYGTNFETRPEASRRRSQARDALASDRSEAIGRSAGRLVARATAEARKRRQH